MPGRLPGGGLAAPDHYRARRIDRAAEGHAVKLHGECELLLVYEAEEQAHMHGLSGRKQVIASGPYRLDRPGHGARLAVAGEQDVGPADVRDADEGID